MAVLLGNHSMLAIRNNRPVGAGVTNRIDAVGAIELHGKQGEVVYLSGSDVVPLGPVDTPIHLQVLGGSVNVSFTLVNPARSTDPVQQDTSFWVNVTSVAAGSIVQAPVLNFAAIRIEFIADAELYIMGR